MFYFVKIDLMIWIYICDIISSNCPSVSINGVNRCFHLPQDSMILCLLYRKTKCTCPQKDMHSNVNNSFICNSPKLETNQMSIKRWTCVKFPYQILLLRKWEQTCSNMHGSQKVWWAKATHTQIVETVGLQWGKFWEKAKSIMIELKTAIAHGMGKSLG